MSTINIIILIISSFIILYIIYNYLIYLLQQINSPLRKRKTDYYKLALQRSIETGKPLMVIGDPESGAPLNRHVIHNIIGTPYEYGDLCVDLTGCPKNPSKNSIKGKLEDIISSFADNSYVIFSSQLIEYIDNDLLDDVLLNLIRVSGGDIFMVNMNYIDDAYTDSLEVFIRKNNISKCPPEFDYIEYSKYNPENQHNEPSKIIKI